MLSNLIIFGLILGIFISLANSFYYLLKHKTTQTQQYLKNRIILSLILFFSLFGLFYMDWITPHTL